MSRRLPLNSLRAFEAAARHASLSGAAAELHVTHGAISRQVRALEDWLGHELFVRLPRGLRLTQAGEALVDDVAAAFRLLANSLDRQRERRARSVVTITTLPSLATRWLIPRLERFAAAQPGLEIRVTTSTQLCDLRPGDVDIGIRYGAGKWPGLQATPLFSAHELPVCAPRLLRGPRALKTPQDLSHHVLLHDGVTDGWTRWLAMAGVRNCDATKGPVYEDRNVLIQAAIEGLGVALAADPLAAGEVQAGRLVVPFPLKVLAPWSFFAVCLRERAAEPPIASVLAWLQREAERTTALL